MTPNQIEKLNFIIGGITGVIAFLEYTTRNKVLEAALERIVQQLEQLRDEDEKN